MLPHLQGRAWALLETWERDGNWTWNCSLSCNRLSQAYTSARIPVAPSFYVVSSTLRWRIIIIWLKIIKSNNNVRPYLLRDKADTSSSFVALFGLPLKLTATEMRIMCYNNNSGACLVDVRVTSVPSTSSIFPLLTILFRIFVNFREKWFC